MLLPIDNGVSVNIMRIPAYKSVVNFFLKVVSWYLIMCIWTVSRGFNYI